MLAEILFVAQLEAGVVHGRHDVAGSEQLPVGEHVAVDEAVAEHHRVQVARPGDAVVQQPPAGAELAVEEAEVRRQLRLADMLGEPDRRDGVEAGLGDGDGRLFIGFAKSLDVIAHELAHGITQYTANLDYYGQSGALNEHFSDVMGTVITQFHNGETAETADWLIGDEIMGPELQGEA